MAIEQSSNMFFSRVYSLPSHGDVIRFTESSMSYLLWNGFHLEIVDYLHNRNTAIALVEHLAWKVIIVTSRIKNWLRLLMTFSLQS